MTGQVSIEKYFNYHILIYRGLSGGIIAAPLSTAHCPVLRGKIIKAGGDKEPHDRGNVETIQTFITVVVGLGLEFLQMSNIYIPSPISQISTMPRPRPTPTITADTPSACQMIDIDLFGHNRSLQPISAYDDNYSFYCHSNRNQFNVMMVVMAIEVRHETIREMILSFNSQLLIKPA